MDHLGGKPNMRHTDWYLTARWTNSPAWILTAGENWSPGYYRTHTETLQRCLQTLVHWHSHLHMLWVTSTNSGNNNGVCHSCNICQEMTAWVVIFYAIFFACTGSKKETRGKTGKKVTCCSFGQVAHAKSQNKLACQMQAICQVLNN